MIDDYFTIKLEELFKHNRSQYNSVCTRELKYIPNKDQIVSLNKETQSNLYIKILEEIRFEKSPYDLKKLTRAIQNSRSGMGGASMTKYECNFCGSIETWGNTATPGICSKCAEKMAKNLIQHNSNFMKEDPWKHYEDRIQELEGVLGYYADEANYELGNGPHGFIGSAIDLECGERAREVLGYYDDKEE